MTKNFWFLVGKRGFYVGLGPKGRVETAPDTYGAWRFSDAEAAYQYLKTHGLEKHGFTITSRPVDGFQFKN